jgi:hypothetical protein
MAAVAALAYALPLALAAVSDAGHGAAHVMEQLRERQAAAAALGLAHLGERTAYTHTHGGDTHSHVGTVGALLVAAEQANAEQEAAPPPVQLSAHAPARTVQVLVALSITRVAATLDAFVPAHPRALPPIPPPRG